MHAPPVCLVCSALPQAAARRCGACVPSARPEAGTDAMDAGPPPGGGGGGGGGGGAGKGDGEGNNRLRRRGQQSMDVFGGTEGQAVLFIAVLMYVVQQLTTWANSNCSC